jgi:hypothetical protein
LIDLGLVFKKKKYTTGDTYIEYYREYISICSEKKKSDICFNIMRALCNNGWGGYYKIKSLILLTDSYALDVKDFSDFGILFYLYYSNSTKYCFNISFYDIDDHTDVSSSLVIYENKHIYYDDELKSIIKSMS